MKNILTLFFCSLVLSSGAQCLRDVKNLYMNLDETKFRVSISNYDNLIENYLRFTQWFEIKYNDTNPSRDWFRFDLKSLSRGLYYAEYSPLKASTTVWINGEKETFQAVSRFDSMGCPTQGMRVFSSFNINFPFVKCFYEMKESELNRKIKIVRGVRQVKMIHPQSNRFLTLYLNEQLLIDSIKNDDNPLTKPYDTYVFDYLYFKAGGKVIVSDRSAADSAFPMSISNPCIFKQVSRKYVPPKLNRDDSLKIKQFITSTGSKYTLVDFWFIGCRPCHRSFPDIRDLEKSFDGKTLKVFCLNPIDRPDLIEVFKRKTKFKLDFRSDSLKMKIFLGVEVFPSCFLFDANGNIIMSHTSYDPEFFKQIREYIRKNE